jgi:hypothetical protein
MRSYSIWNYCYYSILPLQTRFKLELFQYYDDVNVSVHARTDKEFMKLFPGGFWKLGTQF